MNRVGFCCKYLHPDQTQSPKVLESIQRNFTEKQTPTSIQIPEDIAVGITIATLQKDLVYTQAALSEWRANPKTKNNPDGVWMHPDDVVENITIIDNICNVLAYYGAIYE